MYRDIRCDKRNSYINLVTTVTWQERVTTVYRGADKSLPRPGRKQATATEDLEFHISCL